MTAKEARQIAENSKDVKEQIKNFEEKINQSAMSGCLSIEIKGKETNKGIFTGIVKEFTKEKQKNRFKYTIVSKAGQKVVFFSKQDILMKKGDEFEAGW